MSNKLLYFLIGWLQEQVVNRKKKSKCIEGISLSTAFRWCIFHIFFSIIPFLHFSIIVSLFKSLYPPIMQNTLHYVSESIIFLLDRHSRNLSRINSHCYQAGKQPSYQVLCLQQFEVVASRWWQHQRDWDGQNLHDWRSSRSCQCLWEHTCRCCQN